MLHDHVVARLFGFAMCVLIGVAWYFEKKWSLSIVGPAVFGLRMTSGEIEVQAMLRFFGMLIAGVSFLVVPWQHMEDPKKKS